MSSIVFEDALNPNSFEISANLAPLFFVLLTIVTSFAFSFSCLSFWLEWVIDGQWGSQWVSITNIVPSNQGGTMWQLISKLLHYVTNLATSEKCFIHVQKLSNEEPILQSAEIEKLLAYMNITIFENFGNSPPVSWTYFPMGNPPNFQNLAWIY